MDTSGILAFLPLVIGGHGDWAGFAAWCANEHRRIVLLSSHASKPYTHHAFEPHDCLLFGRESGGVPESVAHKCDTALTIPMAGGMRSLNLAVSVAMVAGEVRRQHPLAQVL